MSKLIFRLALLATLLTATTFAGTTFILTGPGVGTAGGSVTLYATATNTGGIDQSLDSLVINLAPEFTDYDVTAFVVNWPLQLDASGPGSQFGPAAIFDVLIPVGTPTGIYTGSTALIYGDGGATLLATVPFEIDVVSAVPEPTAISLAASGLALLTLVRLRKRR